jgi:hypothetical protein
MPAEAVTGADGYARRTADITYILTRGGWLYLAAVMDLFSRKISGWAMAPTIPAELVCHGLQMAIASRSPRPNLIVHPDRGSQYASDTHRALLARHPLVASMSRKGNCWDNAVMERFFLNLKNGARPATRLRQPGRSHIGYHRLCRELLRRRTPSLHPGLPLTERGRAASRPMPYRRVRNYLTTTHTRLFFLTRWSFHRPQEVTEIRYYLLAIDIDVGRCVTQ